jgi:hypothetical protein
MRAVDVFFSHHQSYYSLGRRAKKWWPRLAWFLIDIGIVNAHILYVKHTEISINQRQFRKQLMRELVASFTARKKRGRPNAYENQHIDSTTHRVAETIIVSKKLDFAE